MTVEIPKTGKQCDVAVGRRKVRLTNLDKVFWPDEGITKRDLLQYYADVSDVLLPHLCDRAMVMKRYPNGIAGEFFFMKRAPAPQARLDGRLHDRAQLGKHHRLPDRQ